MDERDDFGAPDPKPWWVLPVTIVSYLGAVVLAAVTVAVFTVFLLLVRMIIDLANDDRT